VSMNGAGILAFDLFAPILRVGQPHPIGCRAHRSAFGPPAAIPMLIAFDGKLMKMPPWRYALGHQSWFAQANGSLLRGFLPKLGATGRCFLRGTGRVRRRSRVPVRRPP